MKTSKKESTLSTVKILILQPLKKSNLYGKSEVGGSKALISCIKNERKYQTWEMIVIKT